MAGLSGCIRRPEQVSCCTLRKSKGAHEGKRPGQAEQACSPWCGRLACTAASHGVHDSAARAGEPPALRQVALETTAAGQYDGDWIPPSPVEGRAHGCTSAQAGQTLDWWVRVGLRCCNWLRPGN